MSNFGNDPEPMTLESASTHSTHLPLSVSLPEILRETTMEEFLLAIERVRASDLILEQEDESEKGNEQWYQDQRCLCQFLMKFGYYQPLKN